MNGIEYDWQHTDGTDRKHVSFDINNSFAPRPKPRNFDVRVDNRVHEIPHTEYLIGYCNGLTAIGMIKNERDIRDQFGNWRSQDGRNLHVGCTVAVKSFSQMFNYYAGELKTYSTKTANFSDLFCDGSYYANTQAVDWKIVYKPEILLSLGRIKRMFSEQLIDGRLRLTGLVYDQENKADLKVMDDFWPLHIKEAPEVDTAVIIHWIKMVEPYTVYTGKNGLQVMFPHHAHIYMRDLESRENDHWMGWVDVGFHCF